MRKKRRQPAPMTFADYIALAKRNLIGIDVTTIKPPKTLCGVELPHDLNDLTMDALTDIMQLKDGNLTDLARIVLGIDPKLLLQEPAQDVLGFFNFCTTEYKRINTLFESAKLPPTSQEIRAGIESLSFGIFGTIDWYARRMGITDHNEVMKVKWMRVYQCASNDTKTALYQRQLNQVMIADAKTRR